MAHSRTASVHRGAASGSLAAVIVGALILLVIGYVLGRYTGESAEPAEGAPGAAGAGSPTDPAAETAGPELTFAPPETGEPLPFEFEPAELDFGIVPPDTELRGMVRITNVSDEPLKILKMTSDCRCAVATDLSGQIIMPDEFLETEAVVEGRSYAGRKTSQLSFLFQGYAPASVFIRSIVSRAVRAEPSYIAATKATEGVITVSSLGGEPFRILAVDDEPPVFGDDFDANTDEPRNSYVLPWDISDYDPQTCEDSRGRKMRKWMVIETDHPEAPLLDVRLRHFPCTALEVPKRAQGQYWVLSEQRVVLDHMIAGEYAEFEVYLKWPFPDSGPDDTIERIESESEDFHATLVERKREGDRISCRVRISPAPEFRGLLYGDVRFFAYKPGHSLPLTVIAQVVDAAESPTAAE